MGFVAEFSSVPVIATPTITDAHMRAVQLDRVPAQPTTTITLTSESPRSYGTAHSGTFTVDATACVVGAEANFATDTTATEPQFKNAPATQPYVFLPVGYTYVSGTAYRYSVCVCLDSIEVVALAL